MAKLSPVERAKLKKIMSDPVLWAKAFLISNNANTKKYGPWEARDYQIEMLRDRSLRKVYRCGRRIGKSETMIVEGLWRASVNKNFRVLYVTPYENQVNLIFTRMRELIADSPLVKNEIVKMKSSPYTIEFKNGSTIMGFTTGASSGSGAASIRGQRADALYLDELDYMGANDYSTVAMIAGERPDITMCCSSTPTGKRGIFFEMCTNKRMGYQEHFHPSTHNPGWCKQMEDEFREQLTESQYEHEVMAEFGTEEAGVFNKDMLDQAMKKEFYTYQPLTDIQKRNLSDGFQPLDYIYDEDNPAPTNPFRCMGVDWDVYQAGSSLLILDFDVKKRCFKVIKRVEVPRAQYSLDNAVNWIIKLNQIYRPSWIFCDRGFGDYQIERLHIYGESHPSSGLDKKVVGYQFKESLDIIDPITKEKRREPMKQFMVNQLKLTIERDRLILCPFDETLHKQLIDYSVDRISQSGMPVYTSKDEHFVDALGLAHLAFVLNFPDITQAIKKIKNSNRIEHSSADILNRGANAALRSLSTSDPWKNRPELKQAGKGPGERRGDYQKWVHVPMKGGTSSSRPGGNWGRRAGGYSGRSIW